MIRLYSFPLSPFTSKVRIALYEKGLEFEKINVKWDPMKGITEKPAEMARINPKGQVPTMVDGELAMYDSTVIFEYLEERYPKPPLYPKSVADRVQCRLLEDFGDTTLFDNVAVLIREVFRKPDPATRDNALVEAATAGLRGSFERLDKRLAGADYICGEFSVADIACFIQISTAALLGTTPGPEHARLGAWVSRMQARPSVQRDTAEKMEALAKLRAPQPAN